MEKLTVTRTRTGNERHASVNGSKTLCGRKVTANYGVVGTPIETQAQNADGSWADVTFVPAVVTCEKCNA